jgi:hypothetical protein
VILTAHIAGVPVEETVLGLAPALTAIGGVALFQLRSKLLRRAAGR